jgi:hypothetical protein
LQAVLNNPVMAAWREKERERDRDRKRENPILDFQIF